MAEYENLPIPKDQLLAQLSNAAEMQATTQEDYYQYMGQIYYLIKDEEMTDYFARDPDLQKLLPTFSHLMRTSNVDRDANGKRVSKLMKIRLRRSLRIQLMVIKNPDLVSQAQFDALLNFGEGVIEDMKEGWRGRLVTEKIKTYKIETGGNRPTSWTQRLFGR